jgi:hypothetical protein
VLLRVSALKHSTGQVAVDSVGGWRLVAASLIPCPCNPQAQSMLTFSSLTVEQGPTDGTSPAVPVPGPRESASGTQFVSLRHYTACGSLNQ